MSKEFEREKEFSMPEPSPFLRENGKKKTQPRLKFLPLKKWIFTHKNSLSLGALECPSDKERETLMPMMILMMMMRESTQKKKKKNGMKSKGVEGGGWK